jgi:putative ABC transport system substrate-binding protein
VALLSPGNPEHWLVVRDALERPDIVFDAHSADGRFGQLGRLAMDAVRARPDVIVAHGAAAVTAARKAAAHIPIVMAAATDVAPGGNVTGVAIDGARLAGRIFNLIRELKSNARRIAMLANADDPSAHAFVVVLNQAAARARVPVGMSRVRTAGDYEVAFEQWDRLRLQAVIVHSGVEQARAAQLALRYGIPAIGLASGFVGAGGLLSYSENPRELGRKVVTFIDRILKGAKPAELRVEQLDAFDLAVNLKTAKAIDIELPDSLLARADAMIQ